MFSCEFKKIFKNTFFTVPLRTTASLFRKESNHNESKEGKCQWPFGLPYVFHYVLDEQEGLLQANLWIQTKCTKLGIRENVVLRPSQYLLFQSQHCKH